MIIETAAEEVVVNGYDRVVLRGPRLKRIIVYDALVILHRDTNLLEHITIYSGMLYTANASIGHLDTLTMHDAHYMLYRAPRVVRILCRKGIRTLRLLEGRWYDRLEFRCGKNSVRRSVDFSNVYANVISFTDAQCDATGLDCIIESNDSDIRIDRDDRLTVASQDGPE